MIQVLGLFYIILDTEKSIVVIGVKHNRLNSMTVLSNKRIVLVPFIRFEFLK